jgi:hypothetical protein
MFVYKFRQTVRLDDDNKQTNKQTNEFREELTVPTDLPTPADQA